MSVNIKDMNTRDEVRLLLLQQAQTGVHDTLLQINSKLDSLDKKIDLVESKLERKLDNINNKIDKIDDKYDKKIDKIYWFIIGLYGITISGLLTVLGKSFKFF